jgi:hypothetical protein
MLCTLIPDRCDGAGDAARFLPGSISLYAGGASSPREISVSSSRIPNRCIGKDIRGLRVGGEGFLRGFLLALLGCSVDAVGDLGLGLRDSFLIDPRNDLLSREDMVRCEMDVEEDEYEGG